MKNELEINETTDMGKCKFCNYDLTEFFEHENLCKVLECPQCKHKFKLGYDESWDSETGEESYWFWVKNI